MGVRRTPSVVVGVPVVMMMRLILVVGVMVMMRVILGMGVMLAMPVIMRMVVMVVAMPVVVIPRVLFTLDPGLTLTATAYRTHQLTSNSLIRISSPPVTCS